MTNNKLTDERGAKFDFQALREAAEKATQGKWKAFIHTASRTCSVHTPRDKRCDNVVKWSGFDGQKNAEANAKFIAAANPATVLALLSRLDELRIEVESANARVDIKCAELCGMDEKLAEKDAELQEYRNVAEPKNHFLAGYDVGHSRGLTCGRLYKGDDQVRSHRVAAATTYMEQLENDY